MPLNPYFAAKVSLIRGLLPPDLDEPAGRQAWADFVDDSGGWEPPPGLTIADDVVVHDDVRVPVRVYQPAEVRAGPLVWLHGGGFTGGDLDMVEAHVVAAEVAARAGARVVSVGYRLAGGAVRFPAPVDDAVAAWRWTAEGGKVPAVGGASAGAAVALAAALRLRDAGGAAPRAVVLAYPFVHFPVPALAPALAQEMATLPPLLRFTPEAVEAMVRAYVGRLHHLPPEALPGAADLTGLPPTSVITSELDDLRPSGDLLVRQLEEAGGTVSSLLAEGVFHGHLNRLPAVPGVGPSLDFVTAAVRG